MRDDGMRDEHKGEECDDAGESAVCNRDCTLVRCGDGQVNTLAGEECDDGNAVSGDGCSTGCWREYCGNGFVEETRGEECDDGNEVNGDGCSADCLSGKDCGDGIVDVAREEQCDDGNKVSGDGCSAGCWHEYCGNGTVDPDEECDDGNQVSGDGCSADCLSREGCGNGIVDVAREEQCDDGNKVSGDGCSAECWHEYCGNGTVDPDEECDDGNQASGDGCSADCLSREGCGNGIVDTAPGEQCDDAGPSARCDSDCTLAACGDGEVNALAAEACDEGGVNTSGCNWDCTVPRCGDGLINLEAGEECETGGESVFCDSDCTFAWCGDGRANAAAGEECDDGNADNGDWCLSSCESASCEDGIRNGDEQYVDCGGLCESCGVGTVVVGGFHTCALMETGTVRCWGEGSSGQLGYGNMNTIGDDEVPAMAGDVNVGGRVVQLAAGSYHTCALMEEGTVRCWGEGRSGQLGYGNTRLIGDNEVPATAGDVDVGGRVVQLAAGGSHTCALMEAGTVRCWGGGWYGQLGYGNTNTIGDDEVPATAGDVDVGGRVVQLAAGSLHICVLMEEGTVRCWGVGDFGQLGYGNTNTIGDDEVPATAGDVDVGGRVVQLAAGVAHTCALMETGIMRCWGGGWYGQLGYGNTYWIGDDELPSAAGDVEMGDSVVQLASGGYHTCARVETGTVRCWGSGWSGQLGYGNTSNIGDDETPAAAGDVLIR